MSSIGTGYDLAASTFSPDGRIFQVEYAQKAVDNGGTVIAIRGKDGVVTAVDKVVGSKLALPVNTLAGRPNPKRITTFQNANPRVGNVNDFIGCTSAGFYPDCLALLDYVQGEALEYLKEFREPVPAKKIANTVRSYIFFAFGATM